jgi:hypothetical protein
VSLSRTQVEDKGVSLGVTKRDKPLPKSSQGARHRVYLGHYQNADACDTIGLLRPRHHRPCRRACQTCDELPPSHP